jgi:hypothetical protein
MRYHLITVGVRRPLTLPVAGGLACDGFQHQGCEGVRC